VGGIDDFVLDKPSSFLFLFSSSLRSSLVSSPSFPPSSSPSFSSNILPLVLDEKRETLSIP
jgi:hypothetical protein